MDPNNSLEETAANARSMLVVADNHQLSEKLFDHLVRQQWHVEFAMSNDEALVTLRLRPFDLIITAQATSAAEDIHLLQRIRSFRPHTRMIILTTGSTTEQVTLALRAHAFSYFSGSYTFESLQEMIHLAMEKPCWDDGIEVAFASPVWIRLLVRCDRETAERLMQFFVEFADMPEEEKGQVAYALREMVVNAISYGGRFDPSQYVEVSYLRARRAVKLRVKDPGEGFSLDELRHAAISNPPDDPARHIYYREEAGLPGGGYGILLSRHLVDELIYNEFGNEVVLIKYLSAAPAGNRAEFKTA